MKRLTRLFGEIKRLSPSTPLEVVKKEMKSELEKIGPENLKDKLLLEAEALEELQEEATNRRRRSAKSAASVLQRSKQGYNIGGLFWQLQQENLNAQHTPEEWTKMKETKDWLEARQFLSAQVLEKETPGDESFFEKGPGKGF